MANFEDTGTYYANEEMMKEFIVLSMDSGLVYDTEDVRDVHIIRLVSDTFFAMAKKDITDFGSCFCGEASTYTGDDGKLNWKF